MSDLKILSNGQEVFWNGHLCEGSQIIASNYRDTFILWTRCGAKDVPAGKGYIGPTAPNDIKCPECLKIWNEENGQFGVGA